MSSRFTFAILTIFTLVGASHAQSTKSPNLIELLGHSSANSLSGELRGYIVKLMPTTLYEKKIDWGKQKLVARGLKWKGLKPKIQKSHKNHGTWQKIRIVAPNFKNALVFDVRNIREIKPGTARFQVFISFDIRAFYDRQNWLAGVRVIAGSIRARARVRALVHCQLSSRLEKKKGSFIPDAVFEFRALKANVGYDQLVVEHVYGLGGEAAQLIGSAAKSMIHQFKPSLERELLHKANSAIVQSLKKKEVRVSFSKLLGGLSK